MHISKIKITIVISVSIVILGMVGGIFALKNNYYWQKKFIKLQLDYIKTEIYFQQYEKNPNANYDYNIQMKSIKPALETIKKIISGKPEKEKNTMIDSEKADSIPILLYHGVISKRDWKPDDVNIRLEDFRNQMFALKKSGYRTITMEDLIEFSKGRKKLPKKSFMLTFDDGRKDSYYPVDPILRTLDYTAVMNIITNRSLGKDNETNAFHLTEIELEKMIDSGRWEIESHGKNNHDYQTIDPDGKKGHFLSNKLWMDSEKRLEEKDDFEKRIREDLLASKTDLEKNLGIEVSAYAYPFGDFGQATENFPESRKIIKDTVESIYSISFRQIGNSDFPANFSDNSRWAKRINANSHLTTDNLLATLDNSQEKKLDYSDNFSKNSGWIRGWGTVSFDENGITLSDSKTEDSGLVFLNGSYLWKNYTANAIISTSIGNEFAILARYKDGNNFVACDFSSEAVTLTQKVDGKDRPDLSEYLKTRLGEKKEARIGIYANKNEAGCTLDEKIIVKGEIDKNLGNGGIGFKIWETGRKGISLTIKKLEVKKIIPRGSKQEVCAIPAKKILNTGIKIDIKR